MQSNVIIKLYKHCPQRIIFNSLEIFLGSLQKCQNKADISSFLKIYGMLIYSGVGHHPVVYLHFLLSGDPKFNLPTLIVAL